MGFHHDHRRRRALLAVSYAGLAFLAGLYPARSALVWDEGVYLASAETLLSPDPYFTEIHQRPPLLPVLLHLGSYAMPLELFGRLLSAAFLALGVLALLFLGSRLYGDWEGAIAAALMLASPYFLWWSGAVLSDIPAAALVAASLCFLFRSAEPAPERVGSAFLSGAFLAAAHLMRWTSVLAGVGALSLLLLGRLRPRPAVALGLGFLSLVVPHVLWAHWRLGDVLAPMRQAMEAIEGSEPVADPFYYLRAVVIVAAPAALLGLVLYLLDLAASRGKGWLTRDLPLVLCAAVFPLYLSTVVHKETRYVLAAIPPLFLLAGKGFGRVLRANGPVLRGAVAALAGVCLWWTFSHFDHYRHKTRGFDYRLAASADTRSASGFLRRELPPGQVVYANHLWPVLAYHSKLETRIVRPHDRRFFGSFPQNMPESGLFVHYPEVEKEPSEEWLAARPEFRRLERFGRVVVYSYRAPSDTVGLDEASALIDEAAAAYGRRELEHVLELLTPIGDQAPRVACLRGWSLYKLGEIEEAAMSFEAGLETNPGDRCAQTGLAYCRLRAGRPEDAEPLFAAVLAGEPDSIDALVGLGLSYLRQDRRSDAARQFRRALELSPDNREAREHLRRAEALPR